MQIEEIADAFEAWELWAEAHGIDARYQRPTDSMLQDERDIYVVDLFCA